MVRLFEIEEAANRGGRLIPVPWLTMTAMVSPAPAVVVTPTTTMAPNLNDVTVWICDHRLLLGDGHSRADRVGVSAKAQAARPINKSHFM